MFKHVNTVLYCIVLIHDEILMYVRELHYSGWNKDVWGSDGPGDIGWIIVKSPIIYTEEIYRLKEKKIDINEN